MPLSRRNRTDVQRHGLPQPGPSARQIGQSAHDLAAGRTGTCGSWTLAETHYSPGATWTSTRSAFSSCTGASNAHVSTMPDAIRQAAGFLLDAADAHEQAAMAYELAGGNGHARAFQARAKRHRQAAAAGEPRQRHWHLAYRRDASAMTPGPMPPSPMAIRQACRVNPMRVRIIWTCRAGTVTNSSGIRGSTSCPATSPIERSVARRRCYRSRSCCSPPRTVRALVGQYRVECLKPLAGLGQTKIFQHGDPLIGRAAAQRSSHHLPSFCVWPESGTSSLGSTPSRAAA